MTSTDLACARHNPHTPHGTCPGTAPEYPWERVEQVTETGHAPAVKFIVIRQARTKVIGSRVMTRAEAEREAAVWRDEIGPACYVPATAEARSLVRRDDSDALAKILYETFPDAGKRTR